jgi:hypothetical protein
MRLKILIMLYDFIQVLIRKRKLYTKMIIYLSRFNFLQIIYCSNRN